MKKIVVVDDRPWKLKESICRLQQQGVNFGKTIYYPSKTLEMRKQQELMTDYREKTGIDIVQVNSHKEFVDSMDELYKDPGTAFLMDYDLKGDMNKEDFFTRVNVKYALIKDADKKKIWFYTSGPVDIQGLLSETFPGQIINEDIRDGQMYWDEKQVKDVAGV